MITTIGCAEDVPVRGYFRLLYAGFAILGELLLYCYFLSPAIVDQRLALVSLSGPEQSVLFGTVWPYLSIIHLFALVISVSLFVLGSRQSIMVNKPFIIYAAINIVGIGLLPLLSPSTQPVYFDFALEFCRLASLTLLASMVLEARDYDPAILARGLIGLFAVPLLLLIFTNPFSFLSERGGRLNAPGLEITSTGHAGALAILLGFSTALRLRYRLPLIVLGGICLLTSGSRIPLILAASIVAVQVWRSVKGFGRRAALILGFAGTIALFFVLASSDSIAGGRLATLTGGGSQLEGEFALGRGVALLTALRLIARHPFGYIDSDWGIQQELVHLGFPSHTHSFYLQSYLRFGPLIFLFIAVMCWRATIGARRKSPYVGCLWFIIIGCALDYYGFVTKMMLIVFMVTLLNESRIQSSVSCS